MTWLRVTLWTLLGTALAAYLAGVLTVLALAASGLPYTTRVRWEGLASLIAAVYAFTASLRWAPKRERRGDSAEPHP